LTNRSSATEQNSYSYNLQNKLSTAIINRTDSGHTISETVNFTCDYKGNRVRAQWVRSVDGGAVVNRTNIFLNDADQTLEELPIVGSAPTVSYAIGGHTQSKGGTISHFLSDGHGSTRQLVDTNGNITVRFTYDAYGKGLDFTNNTQSPTATALLYSGGRNDPDLLQYSLGDRYYNPTVGRFSQIDPFGPNQRSGMNLYTYCGNDPINNIDPTGNSFFAFDGTCNWEFELDNGRVSPTNVRKMYMSSSDKHRHYYRGVGNEIDYQGYAAFEGYAGGEGVLDIIDRAESDLKSDRQSNDYVCDIIGFSRGGVEAIEFANRIAEKYPGETIRFVGLFDPVGSIGGPGSFGRLRSTLPSSVRNSSEAFARDENRLTFHATDAHAAVPNWFRGVHSDIGGGFANHDIADWVLEWMTAQAQGAGVSLDLSRVKQKYGWNPQANGMINKNTGSTSWITDKGPRQFASQLNVSEMSEMFTGSPIY
jgi:RHS repeat-associated protein